MKELKVGDIIAMHRRNGFLPKGIQYFMKLWAKIHYHKKLDKYYNHTMTVIKTDPLLISEAVAKGFTVSELELEPDVDYIVFRLKEPLTYEEQCTVFDKSLDLAFSNIEYEIVNFAWWIPYILSNGKIDLSPKNKEKKLFCFETSAITLNAARPLFDVPDKVNTVDLYFDERFDNFELQ